MFRQNVGVRVQFGIGIVVSGVVAACFADRLASLGT
jgi:hypothetical protein